MKLKCTVSCLTASAEKFVCEKINYPDVEQRLLEPFPPLPLLQFVAHLLHFVAIFCLLFVGLFVEKRCSWISQEILVRQIPLNSQIQFESGPMQFFVEIDCSAGS